MIFDKRQGHIFNVRLNASEAKALEDYCQKYLQEKVDAYIAEKKEEIEKTLNLKQLFTSAFAGSWLRILLLFHFMMLLAMVLSAR